MIKQRKIKAIRAAMEKDQDLNKILDQTPEEQKDNLAEEVLDEVVANRTVEAERKKPGSLIDKVKGMLTRKKKTT